MPLPAQSSLTGIGIFPTCDLPICASSRPHNNICPNRHAVFPCCRRWRINFNTHPILRSLDCLSFGLGNALQDELLFQLGGFCFDGKCRRPLHPGIIYIFGCVWVNVVYDSEEIDLKGATFSACPGEFPHKTNHVVQWRGYRKGGKFMPYAMIYRMTSDVNGKSVETLVVVQLSGSGSRVIGKVASNKEGNEGAEKLADKECAHLVAP